MDTIVREVDILVAGGGPGGVSAALSAGKCGADVLLLDMNGFLGGTLVSGIVGSLCGMFSARRGMDDTTFQVVQGIGEEIHSILDSRGGSSQHNNSAYFDSYAYDPCMLPVVLDELALRYNVKMLLHTMVIGAKVENGRITEVETASKSGRMVIKPKLVIDGTGDADIVHLSGGSYRKDAAQLQPGSFNFRMSNVDPSYPIPTLPEVAAAIREATKDSPKSYLLREDSMFIKPSSPTEVICGFSRISVDATDVESLTRAEILGRSEVYPAAEFIRNTFPGFRNAKVCNLPTHVGIRETRIIEGVGILTDDDVYYARTREDGIGKCAWPVERHVAGERHTVVMPLHDGDSYDIPFSALLPVGYKNLAVAGRSISSERAANASARVYGPCTVMGQAAGTAAALLAAKGIADYAETNIGELRKKLAENGALV